MNSTYKTSTFENGGILEIVITGVVTRSCYENVENEFNTIVKSMTVRKLLLDVREVKGRVGYLDAYSRVRNYSSSRHIKTAIVDIPENADFQSFQEAAAKKVGLFLKWFTDIDAARAWLKSKGENRWRIQFETPLSFYP